MVDIIISFHCYSEGGNKNFVSLAVVSKNLRQWEDRGDCKLSVIVHWHSLHQSHFLTKLFIVLEAAGGPGQPAESRRWGSGQTQYLAKLGLLFLGHLFHLVLGATHLLEIHENIYKQVKPHEDEVGEWMKEVGEREVSKHQHRSDSTLPLKLSNQSSIQFVRPLWVLAWCYWGHGNAQQNEECQLFCQTEAVRSAGFNCKTCSRNLFIKFWVPQPATQLQNIFWQENVGGSHRHTILMAHIICVAHIRSLHIWMAPVRSSHRPLHSEKPGGHDWLLLMSIWE